MANETALSVIEQSPAALVEYVLEDYPTSEYNRLIPTDVLGLSSDLIRAIVQVVRLDEPGDTYTSKDLPLGHVAPTAKGLKKLMGPAGIDHVGSARLDDAKDPERCFAQVSVEMVDATGRRRRALGSRDYNLAELNMKPDQLKRARGNIWENAETRALSRGIRALLSLAQSYPEEVIRKPFAVVSIVPNMQHPEVKKLFLEGLAPAIAATYGPGAKQLGPGTVVEVPEVPDEPRNVTPAPAVPPTLPGEKLAAAAGPADEPDWLKPSTTTPAAAPATKRRGAKGLVERLAESYDASELQGDATESQQLVLRDLVKDLPWATELYPVLRAAFGEAWDGKLDNRAVGAILTIAEAYAGADQPLDFGEAWKAAASDARKAAA